MKLHTYKGKYLLFVDKWYLQTKRHYSSSISLQLMHLKYNPGFPAHFFHVPTFHTLCTGSMALLVCFVQIKKYNKSRRHLLLHHCLVLEASFFWCFSFHDHCFLKEKASLTYFSFFWIPFVQLQERF